MPQPAKPNVRRQVVLVILLFLAMGGAWTWRLWPRESVAEVDQTVRLGQMKVVAAYLSKAPPEVVTPILASLAAVSDPHLAVLHQWVDKSSTQQLRELTVQNSLPVEKGVREALMLAWLGQAEKGPLMEALLMIAASGERLGDDVKLYALERLGREAMSQGQPKVAVAILERALKQPNATRDTLNQLVEVCRAADERPTAIACVNAWIRMVSKERETPAVEDARDLEVNLMLEAGRADEALSGQIEILMSAPPDLLPERVLDRAWTAAMAANQTQRLASWVEKHLANFQEHRMPWQKLLGQSNLVPDYRRWLHCLTGIAEEQTSENRTFDLLLRLAACGEGGAVPRLCELGANGKRRDELESFVTKALADPALAGDVLAAAQESQAVGRMVAQQLRERAHDRELHFAAAVAESAARPAGQAAMVWQNFLRRFPDEEAAQRRLVQAHLAARQVTMARRVLDEMNEENLTEAEERQIAVLRQL